MTVDQLHRQYARRCYNKAPDFDNTSTTPNDAVWRRWHQWHTDWLRMLYAARDTPSPFCVLLYTLPGGENALHAGNVTMAVVTLIEPTL